MSSAVVREYHEKRLRARADERIMAALTPGRGYGWSGGLMQGDRVTQVMQMQNWFGVGVDIIAKLGAQIIPNIAYVRPQARPGKTQKWFTHNYEHMRDLTFGGQSIVSGSYRRKALSVIKPHEELEPVEQNHPLRKLQEDPNPWDTQFDHDYELIMYQYLNGVAYDWAAPSGFRNERGESIPRGLWCMPTPWVWPRTGGGELVNPNNPYADHIISYYEIRPFGMGTAGAGVIRLPPDQIIRYAFKSPINKIDGLAKTWTGRNWLDADNSIAKSQYAQMSNIARPSLFLKLGEGYEDPSDDQIERILAKFRQRNQGELNMGNPFVGTPGMEPIPLDFPPIQMAYSEAMDQSRDRILALLNVPKSAVGLSDSMTFGSILATLMQLCSFAINPLLAANGQTRTKFLASKFSTRDNPIKIWYDDCTPPDPDQLNKDIDTDAKWGAITPNEIRAIRSRQPYKHGGDDPLVAGPGGMIPLPLNTGDDLSDLADMVPLMGRQDNPAAEEEEADAGVGPKVEEPNGKPKKALRKAFSEADHPRNESGEFGPKSGVPAGKKPRGDIATREYVDAFNDPGNYENDQQTKEDVNNANHDLWKQDSKFRVAPDGEGGWKAMTDAEVRSEYDLGEDEYWLVRQNMNADWVVMSEDKSNTPYPDSDQLSDEYADEFNNDPSEISAFRINEVNEHLDEEGSEYRVWPNPDTERWEPVPVESLVAEYGENWGIRRGDNGWEVADGVSKKHLSHVKVKDWSEADHPRGQPDNAGQFGPANGVPKPSAESASSIISRLGSSTWDGLKKAGVSAKAVEHCAVEWVESKAEQNVAKLPEKT